MLDTTSCGDNQILQSVISLIVIENIFPANRVGDDIQVYNDEDRNGLRCVFHTLRQQNLKKAGHNVALADYLAQANAERFILHQIEDPEAVADLDAIAEMEGVDGLFYGPGDYSVRLGIPGQLDHPDVEAVRRQVAETARRHGKIAATVCGPAEVARFADLGYNYLNIGADVGALTAFADAAVAAFGDL